jgi:hypothetical protein
MKASLLHPLREQRHTRRRRRGHKSRGGEQALQPAPAAQPTPAAQPAPSGQRALATPAAHACDPAVQRVRDAGGPVDQASYTCACGYLFSASVSTSVSCPHCGADQAW